MCCFVWSCDFNDDFYFKTDKTSSTMSVHDEECLRRCLLDERNQLDKFLSKYKQFHPTEALVSLVNTRLHLAAPYDRYANHTPLGYAIVQNDSKSVQSLLRNGACAQSIPCTSVDDSNAILSPLHLALTNQCQPLIIDMLVKYGATTTLIVQQDKLCLLEYLVMCPSKATASTLLSGISSFEMAGDNKKRTLLHLAAMNGNGAIISSVLDTAQVNVDMLDSTGKTALMHAADNNAPAVVLLLLDGGATIDSVDPWGRTALHFAVRRACLKTVELLLSSGADVNAKDKKGLTPFVYALSNEKLLHSRSPKENVEDLLECLVRSKEKPISLSKQDFVTAAFWMVQVSEAESTIIKLLEDNDCNVSQRNENGQMLIHIAAEFHKHCVVKWLIEKGRIDSNVTDDNGWQPLHYAAKGGHRETLFYLLNQHGADVNCSTPCGWTPIWLLARSGWTDIACDVIRYGCGVEQTQRVIDLRLAESCFRLPNSLFDPDAQRQNPLGYARSGSRCVSLLEFCTECGFDELARFTRDATYPETSYL